MEYSDLGQLKKLIKQRGGNSNQEMARSLMVQSSNFLSKKGKDAFDFSDDDEDDVVYFDQTTKGVGSIQKNMLFSQKNDNMLNSRPNRGLNDNTMVDYTLERKGNNQATYMMDIKDQA